MRPESSRVAAVRRAGHGSPPRLDSSHPELRSLAVHPLRPPTSAAEPLLRRIEPQIAPTAIAVHRSFASPPTTFLPATLRPKPSRGELLATPSYSPTPSPPESAAAAAGLPRAAAERAAASARTPPDLPARRRSPLPRALGPPGLSGAYAAQPRGRRKPPPPERRKRRRSRRTPPRAALRIARPPRGRPARDSAPLPRASGRLLALGVGRRGRRRALPWPPRLPRPWRAGADEAGEGGDWSWAWAPLQVGPGCQPPPPLFHGFQILFIQRIVLNCV